MDSTAILSPRDAADAVQIVQDAVAAKTPLEILGRGTKRAIGHRPNTSRVLELSALSGVVFYEPEEIVLSAQAGTPLAQIETLLAQNNQELAFEPMDYGPLFGQPRSGGTLGGALAANLSGPRRIKAGAARDHVLGIRAISGRGEAFKSGGRVVKNVTGYDMAKGLAHSWGTLAVFTEITFKVLPRAESAMTLVISGLSDAEAVDILCTAMGSTGEVAGAAHVPLEAARALPGLPHGAATLLRLEGFRPSVLYRAERLEALIGGSRTIHRLEDEASRALWLDIRDAVPLTTGTHALWRISTAPTAGPAVVSSIRNDLPARYFYDWSGGLVWLRLENDMPDDGAQIVRRAVAAHGGHATLIHAPAAAHDVPRFQPQAPAMDMLTRKLKAQFDPLNLLNPGRMG